MASSKWIDKQFGQRLKEGRKTHGWTQPQMAELLAERCSQSIDASTIAKIEAGRRSVRINEAVAIADLFEVSVDALVGRQQPDDTTLTFAMANLSGYSQDARRRISQVYEVGAAIDDILEDVADRFDLPNIESMRHAARDMVHHLAEAETRATELDHVACLMIATPDGKAQR